MKIISGAGLGFRRELIPALKGTETLPIDFFEIAPENWMGIGGRFARDLHSFTERYPFVCHGLSLSLGGTEPLDTNLLKQIKEFMRTHQIPLYTEHMSWGTDDGHLYDLLPIPCTGEAVEWVVQRIRQAQDTGHAHWGGKRILLLLASRGRDERGRVHLGGRQGIRLFFALGCQQHLRQQSKLRLRSVRVPQRAATGQSGLCTCCWPFRGTGRADYRYSRRRCDRPRVATAEGGLSPMF